MPISVARALVVGEFIAPAVLAEPSVLPGRSAFASPKSSTFTVPSSRTLILAGFRSRWMTFCSCAASSASAICVAIATASASGSGPRAMRSASVGPSTSSSTSAFDRGLTCPADDAAASSSMPWMCAMFG